VALAALALGAALAASGATLAASAVSLALLRRATLVDPALRRGYTPLTTRAGLGAALDSVLTDGALPPQALALHSATHALRLASGYGLFRQMTGQGPEGVVDAWGAPVATTLRPEVVVEGWWPGSLGGAGAGAEGGVWVEGAAAGGGEGGGEGSNASAGFWREIPFPYKPGPVARAPAFVAPHSPRLDWQLWFAALDTRAREPYLQHLASLVLHGSPAVYALLLPAGSRAGRGEAAAALGWPVVARVGGAALAVPPRRLRMRRYGYDLARPAWAPWVRHRHQALGAFFGLAAGEAEGEGNASAWWHRAPVDAAAEPEAGARARAQRGAGRGRGRRGAGGGGGAAAAAGQRRGL
jgi:hypothetical protein